MGQMASSVAVIIGVLLVAAVQISNKIEKIAREGKPKNIPTYANFFSTASGKAGKHSAETLRLRTYLRITLLGVLLLMTSMALSVTMLAP